MGNLEILNYKKPEPRPGELMCDACWNVSADKRGWLTFKFKHLKTTNLCPLCIPKEAERLAQLQSYGL